MHTHAGLSCLSGLFMFILLGTRTFTSYFLLASKPFYPVIGATIISFCL